MEIKNRDEIRSELANILKRLDKELNRYQTDIYAYLDDEGNAELHEFTNVGGNSWLADEHYIIHRDRERFDDPIDFFRTEEEIADAIGITTEELINQAAERYNYAPADVDFIAIYGYAKWHYADKIREVFESDAFEFDVDYEDIAEDIIARFEEEINSKED